MAAKLVKRTTRNVKYSSRLQEKLAMIDDGMKKDVLRPAVYAGAKFLYQLLGTNTPRDDGQMQAAVYHWHDDHKSTELAQYYAVGINMKKAPHWHLVEYGHWRYHVIYKVGNKWYTNKKRLLPVPKWVPAYPFIRPTWIAGREQAMSAMRERMKQKVGDMLRTVEATNRFNAKSSRS